MMKNANNAAIVIFVHQEDSVPWKLIKVSIVPLINTPNKLPNTLPTPPLNSVPPITAEAIASISKPFACSTNPEQVFRQNKNQNYPDSKSSREKYKRIATLVSQAFEVLVKEGKSLNRMKQYKPKKTVTEEHVALVELLKDEGADLITLIERLVVMNK